MSADQTKHHQRLGWIAGLMFASGGVIFGLKASDAINSSTAYVLMLAPLGLMVAFFLTARKAQTDLTSTSRAARRYLTGIFASSMAYLLGFGIAITVWNNASPSPGMTWLLAMLPIIPIMAMIYVMGRYIVEEQDEYLRQRAIMASLVGLGFVLTLGSFWGFLETFELVPHVPGWWAVPVWAVGMAVGQGWLTWRERAHDSDAEEEA